MVLASREETLSSCLVIVVVSLEVLGDRCIDQVCCVANIVHKQDLHDRNEVYRVDTIKERQSRGISHQHKQSYYTYRLAAE
jgi:hypothetical protein